MSSSKHTPGPWAIYNGCNVYPDNGDTKARHHVAEVTPEGWQSEHCDITPEEHKANARLIAAAPELLEALQDMVSDHECLSKPTIDFARRAIAKATQP